MSARPFLMLRFIIILLASILLITLLRAIVGVLMRGFSDLLKSESAGPAAGARKPPEVPITGELKKDPVCGTFVSTSTTLKKIAGGEMVYFCSPECRDKFEAESLHR